MEMWCNPYTWKLVTRVVKVATKIWIAELMSLNKIDFSMVYKSDLAYLQSK